MNKSEIIEMMNHQANSLRVMGAAMLDYSHREDNLQTETECDEWHVHGVELQCAAGKIEEWVEVIGGEE